MVVVVIVVVVVSVVVVVVVVVVGRARGKSAEASPHTRDAAQVAGSARVRRRRSVPSEAVERPGQLVDLPIEHLSLRIDGAPRTKAIFNHQ